MTLKLQETIKVDHFLFKISQMLLKNIMVRKKIDYRNFSTGKCWEEARELEVLLFSFRTFVFDAFMSMKYMFICLLCAFNFGEFAFNYPYFERKKRDFLFENVPLCPCMQEAIHL